jgi:hypothetical protein
VKRIQLPPLDMPDPELDQAHLHLDRVARHVKRGRVALVIEKDEWMVIGYEARAGSSRVEDVARFMSETPRGKR